MPQRSLYTLIGAIALGLLAVFLMRAYIGPGSDAATAAAAPAPRSTQIVVAAAPLEPSAVIDTARLKLVAWPVDSIPVGSFTSLSAIPAGRALAVALVAGEPLLASKLAGNGPRAGIATRIGPAMRAATIRVTDVTGTGGFILPGERVDVLVTQTATQTNTPFTDLLAENVKVIAVNQDANEAKDKPEVVQSVTVEVTPLQAAKLALAQVVGTVSLNLRNPGNTVAGTVPTVHVTDLKDRVATAPMRPAATNVRKARGVRAPRASAGTTIVVVRGVERTSYQIARSE